MDSNAFIKLVAGSSSTIPADIADKLIAFAEMLSPEERSEISEIIKNAKKDQMSEIEDGLMKIEGIIKEVKKDEREQKEKNDRESEKLPSFE